MLTVTGLVIQRLSLTYVPLSLIQAISLSTWVRTQSLTKKVCASVVRINSPAEDVERSDVVYCSQDRLQYVLRVSYSCLMLLENLSYETHDKAFRSCTYCASTCTYHRIISVYSLAIAARACTRASLTCTVGGCYVNKITV